MMRVGRCAGNSSTRCAGSGPKASLTIASVERYLAAAGASWRRGLSVNVSGASIFTSLPRIVPVSRDHFVGDAHHTGYSLGQVNERGALSIGADEPQRWSTPSLAIALRSPKSVQSCSFMRASSPRRMGWSVFRCLGRAVSDTARSRRDARF